MRSGNLETPKLSGGNVSTIPSAGFCTESTGMKNHPHPYLSGNFAPIQQERALEKCKFSGALPRELVGGQYVRNGGNPVLNEVLGRDAHWFDGDGMLSGVAFRRRGKDVQPEFANQYILTDVYLSSVSSSSLKSPILPSIATLVSPLSSLLTIVLRILRTIILVFLSHLPGSQQAIKRISVANTSIIYHDGRALATCESGPPLRISLPDLRTIGWFNGLHSEGEKITPGSGFGGDDMLSFFKEWTTAHPRVDPKTSELLLFHSTFVSPYVHYSIVHSSEEKNETFHPSNKNPAPAPRMLTVSVPGVKSAKMMHDFGVSDSHTVIMDLPLSLDPLNLAKNRPVVAYDPTGRSRFGVFPRYHPEDVRWFETNACCIFHTANSWDSDLHAAWKPGRNAVNLLVCRLTSAALVFSAGDIAAPIPTQTLNLEGEELEQCRLYYYQFCLSDKLSDNEQPYISSETLIKHQWALSSIPFEFPSVRDSVSMSAAKYIYGCSVSGASFGAALGRAVKINSLVKVDAETLIARGIRDPPTQITGCVDTRGVNTVLASDDPDDPIKVFMMPPGWYAQESRFVPRQDGVSEDDGWLLSYVFDESQLGADGQCRFDAKSELWVIDAKNMKDVVAKIFLPQRVPYGLHGNWFSEEQVLGQRSFEKCRTKPSKGDNHTEDSVVMQAWMSVRRAAEKFLE